MTRVTFDFLSTISGHALKSWVRARSCFTQLFRNWRLVLTVLFITNHPKFVNTGLYSLMKVWHLSNKTRNLVWPSTLITEPLFPYSEPRNKKCSYSLLVSNLVSHVHKFFDRGLSNIHARSNFRHSYTLLLTIVYCTSLIVVKFPMNLIIQTNERLRTLLY